MYEITEQQLQALLDYLVQKPYNEVYLLVETVKTVATNKIEKKAKK